jgi:hypothetical protein
MAEAEKVALRLNPALAGRIDWDTATHLYLSGIDWDTAGARLASLFRPGDRVRFAVPLDDGEREAVFTVVEALGDRTLVRLVCSLPIPPTQMVATSDLAPA